MTATTESSDPKKKLRNLKKKLNDIESLQSRLDSGELKNPEPEQLEKLKRRSQIESEIQELELLMQNL
jgi:partner of Y14 and mago protein